MGARARASPPGRSTARASTKEEFDRTLSDVLDSHGVGTIALAGFMRILSPWFVERVARANRQHPPFPAARNIAVSTPTRGQSRRATASRGCSVHVVTEELDAGEVLGQAEVPIEPGDTPASLEQRVLAAEHQLYPSVLSGFVAR